MKSPETVMRAPNTSSAEEHLRSPLGAVRMPSNTHGNASDQLGLESRAWRAVFKCQRNRSTKPVVWGLYKVMQCNLIPRSFLMVDHNFDVNWEDLLEDKSNGIPKWAI